MNLLIQIKFEHISCIYWHGLAGPVAFEAAFTAIKNSCSWLYVFCRYRLSRRRRMSFAAFHRGFFLVPMNATIGAVAGHMIKSNRRRLYQSPIRRLLLVTLLLSLPPPPQSLCRNLHINISLFSIADHQQTTETLPSQSSSSATASRTTTTISAQRPASSSHSSSWLTWRTFPMCLPLFLIYFWRFTNTDNKHNDYIMKII